MQFTAFYRNAACGAGSSIRTTPLSLSVLGKYLENEKANDDGLNQKEDCIKLMITLIASDCSSD
jgi:hypothetical protein